MEPILMTAPQELDELKAAAQAARTASKAPRPMPAAPPTAFPKELIEEAARAIRSIPKGAIGGRTLLEQRDSLVRTLQSPTFASFRQRVDQYNASAIDTGSFPLQSISLGIEAGIALGVGAQGSFGVAVPPTQWDNFDEYVVYLTGSLEIGVIEGFLGGVVLGLYTMLPTAMSGGSYGFAIDLGFVEEVEVEGSFQTPDKGGFLGVSITEAGGEFDGFDGMYSYTWIWNWDAPRVFQPVATNYMLLNSIQCNKTGENGHDELYFKFTVDNGTSYRYPTHGHFSIEEGETWSAGRSIYFNDHVYVELWDEDDATDDPRGSTTYSASGFQTSVTVGDNGGQYVLNAVLNPTPPPFPPAMRINDQDTSKDGPYACSFNGQSYLFWRGNSTQYIYSASSSDGVTWNDGHQINATDITTIAPSAISFNNQLFVFWAGTNSGVYWSASDDGMSWPLGAKLPGATTSSSPRAFVFNGTLYLFWSQSASPYLIVYSTFNPSTKSWSAVQTVNAANASRSAVAPIGFNGQLYLFWRNDLSGALCYAFSANNSWPAGAVTNGGESTSRGPAACIYDGKLYVVFISTNQGSNIRYMASTDGRTFPGSIVSSGTTATDFAPGASAFNNGLSLFFTNPLLQLCLTTAIL